MGHSYTAIRRKSPESRRECAAVSSRAHGKPLPMDVTCHVIMLTPADSEVQRIADS